MARACFPHRRGSSGPSDGDSHAAWGVAQRDKGGGGLCMVPWRHRRSSFHLVLAGGEVGGKAFQVVGTVRVKQGTGARAGMLGKGRAGAWGGRQRR